MDIIEWVRGDIMPLPRTDYTADDYWTLPEGKRAELIDGELWDLASPSRVHQEIVSRLTTRLTNHIDARKGSCKVYPAPFAVNLFADDTTFVEPDMSVICDRSKLSDRGCEGAPDFIVEVTSPSNPNMDYISKLSLYRDAGVREYWICDPQRERTRVFVFDPGSTYQALPFGETVSSTVLPGFTISFAQIVADM
jgi:Uma2 family endonuclease